MPLNLTEPVVALALFAALVAATVALIYAQTLIRFVASATAALTSGWRLASAATSAMLDRVIPIVPRNGEASPNRFAAWVAANLAAVAAVITWPALRAPGVATDAAAGVCIVLASVNLMILSGTHWALREGDAIMNDEQDYGRRNFSDLSTAKNASLFAAAALMCALQIAAAMLWVQEEVGIALVAFEARIGLPYADYFVFVLDSIPFISLYTQVSGLSELASPVPGAGAWVQVSINSVASLLMIGGVVAFVQRRANLNAMIERLVVRDDPEGKSVLGGRFKRAPAVIKSYVRARFRSEQIADLKLAYLRLALMKDSYGIPATFIRDYRSLSSQVREGGARLVEQFLKTEQLDEEALQDLFYAVQQSRKSVIHGNAKPEDRYRTGAILAAALVKPLRSARSRNDAKALDRIKDQIRIKLVAIALQEVAKQAPKDSPQSRAAQELLKHGGLA